MWSSRSPRFDEIVRQVIEPVRHGLDRVDGIRELMTVPVGELARRKVANLAATCKSLEDVAVKAIEFRETRRARAVEQTSMNAGTAERF
jgi:hypothetical protein